VDISFPVVILIGWVVLNVIRGAAKAGAEQARRQPKPDSGSGTLPAENPDFLELLRQLEQSRSVPHGRPRRLPAPGDIGYSADDAPEFTEDAESLEAESLEVEVLRPTREPVSLDAKSVEVARRRRLAAASRERPRTDRDHAEFDARIRAVADQTAAGPPSDVELARLRQAMIWREVLGPPVSLRTAGDEPTPR